MLDYVKAIIDAVIYFGCTNRSGIVQIHVAGDRVKVPVLLTEVEIRVYPRGLAADVAEELRLYEDPAVEKQVSGRLPPQSASVLVSPVSGFITVLDVVRITDDFVVRLHINRIPE